MTTERSKLLKVPAKIDLMIALFLSLSAVDTRDGDRALKAAQGTSQIGLMLVLYFYLFHNNNTGVFLLRRLHRNEIDRLTNKL